MYICAWCTLNEFLLVCMNNSMMHDQVTHRDHYPRHVWKRWKWRSVNDLFLNGAFFVASGDHSEIDQNLKKYMVQAKDGSAVGQLTRYAGMLRCTHARPC